MKAFARISGALVLVAMAAALVIGVQSHREKVR